MNYYPMILASGCCDLDDEGLSYGEAIFSAKG